MTLLWSPESIHDLLALRAHIAEHDPAAARAKSRRACGPSFVFLAKPRSCDALKSPRNAIGAAMTNLHCSPC
jgi:hypothetical protein